MHELEGDKHTLASNPDNLKVIFKEMIQMCLWGNATVRRTPHPLYHLPPDKLVPGFVDAHTFVA